MLALCLVAPVAVLVTVEEAGLFTAITWSQPSLELSHRLQLAKEATNAQLWWSILTGLPVCWWLRRFTRAPVFSLMLAVMAAMLLGMSAETPREARVFERLLPAVACVFVFLSIPRQMKNFFAIGVFRLQRGVFHERAFWPAFLLVSGLTLMVAAANYAPLKVKLADTFRICRF